MEGSYELGSSLIGLKSVTFALVVVQFMLICVVDKTVLQVSMLRVAANTRDDINMSASHSINPIETTPLLAYDHRQVRLYDSKGCIKKVKVAHTRRGKSRG